MSAVYYSSKTLGTIDEQYTLQSKTKGVINNGFTIDFMGNGTVQIQNVETVDEVDYIPDGTNRFGSLVELGNGLQEFTLSQDKAFTFSIDRKSNDDTQGAMDMKKAVARQVRVVSIPNTDRYILATAEAYAVTNNQETTGSGTAITTSNAYQRFLQIGEYLSDEEIENEDVIVFMPRIKFNVLKRDAEFKYNSDKAYEDAKAGTVYPVDGMRIVIVPTNYLPDNTNFLAMSTNVIAAPMKTNMTRVLTDVRGIDGSVAEGRRRYDALIAQNRGKALVVDMAA